jgi:hypothetical protein
MVSEIGKLHSLCATDARPKIFDPRIWEGAFGPILLDPRIKVLKIRVRGPAWVLPNEGVIPSFDTFTLGQCRIGGNFVHLAAAGALRLELRTASLARVSSFNSCDTGGGISLAKAASDDIPVKKSGSAIALPNSVGHDGTQPNVAPKTTAKRNTSSGSGGAKAFLNTNTGGSDGTKPNVMDISGGHTAGATAIGTVGGSSGMGIPSGRPKPAAPCAPCAAKAAAAGPKLPGVTPAPAPRPTSTSRTPDIDYGGGGYRAPYEPPNAGTR